MMNGERYLVANDNCQHFLEGLPVGFVHAVITSPPYWQQRDYDKGAAMLGTEPAAWCGEMKLVKRCRSCYVCHLVDDMFAVRRVLRNDGTLWLNIGDKTVDGCLAGIPWTVALVMQAAGWKLRSEVIWHKPDANPGSYPNRPTPGHEHVFQFVKGDNFYDVESVSEPAVYDGNRRQKRTVWTIPTGRYKGAHFATFPEELVATCIKASTSDRGVCTTCGTPWERELLKQRYATRPGNNNKFDGKDATEVGRRDKGRHVTKVTTIGWKQGCGCFYQPARNHPTDGAIVLDPYLGSGTTLAVAVRMGRRGIGCDVVPSFVDLANKRIAEAITAQ